MTKTLLRQIVTLFLVAMGMTACVFDHYEDAEDVVAKHEGEEKVVMLFQVNTMASSSTDENGVSEKIKSLRIFVLNEDSIECNRLIQIDSNVDAVDFSYDFQWWTKPGVKQLIVIANEESVSELSYIPVVTDEPDLEEKAEVLPTPLPTNLTALLNLYSNASEYPNHWNAKELKAVMNAIAFEPEYTVNDKKEIFLPYAVSYADIEVQKAEKKPMPIYLVPVATKFIFKFSNSRSYPVNINGISLAYTNASNYLLGQVGEDDYTKQYEGKDLYWVDWLAEVSKKSWGSQGFSENESFNESVGWIVDYSVPNPEECILTTFVGEELNNTFTIPKGTKITGETEEDETIEPGTYSTSIFYIPESINKTRLDDGDENDDTDDGQRFYLTLKMEDTAPNVTTAPIFENVVIPNLKALFRNTYVIITINMSEGDMELYAEIASWNKKTAHGHVAEGDAPTNNPFKIIGK